MPIEPGDVASVIRLLSPERLRALTMLTGSDDAAIEFVVQRLEATTPNGDMPLAKLLDRDIADVKAKAAALHGRLDAYRSA